ncbi:MAG: hemolysin III family protein [Coriobacteriia bacterium]|nr:hemolysin III family protein [Coriobacteriia bacterium]
MTLVDDQSTHGHPYSLGEEIANAVTHGLGAALSVAALVILIGIAALWGDGWHLASAIIYGVTMFLLYIASTLYHAISYPRARHVLKIIDHSGIYLLIAGTYTPFTLITIRDDGGWWLFSVVWALALIGIGLEWAWVYRPKWVSALVYLSMGWLAVTAIKPIMENLEPAGVWLLVGGGLAYTFGTVFYVLKKVKFMHAVWHLWVLAGSVLHFLAVMLYVFPRP